MANRSATRAHHPEKASGLGSIVISMECSTETNSTPEPTRPIRAIRQGVERAVSNPDTNRSLRRAGSPTPPRESDLPTGLARVHILLWTLRPGKVGCKGVSAGDAMRTKWLVVVAALAAAGAALAAAGTFAFLRAETKRLVRARRAASGETELRIVDPTGAALALFQAGDDLDHATLVPLAGETWLAEGRYFVEATSG